MSVAFELFSAGRAASFVARIRGWSAKGRLIVLSSVEGPLSKSLENRIFEVKDVRDGDLIVGTRQEAEYLLRPRHQGWTAGSLMGVSIAVTVHELSADGPGGAIAVAVVRLSKSR